MRGLWYRGVLFVREPDGTLAPLTGRARLDAMVDDCIEKCLTDHPTDNGNEEEDRTDA